jgi:hypothetical protein
VRPLDRLSLELAFLEHPLCGSGAFFDPILVVIAFVRQEARDPIVSSSCCVAKGWYVHHGLSNPRRSARRRVGGDQRDRSSTAAASFNRDSEPIGQISTQLYVNRVQFRGLLLPCSLGPRVSTEKQARSGKKGSGLGAFNTLLAHLQADAGQQAAASRIYGCFVGRRPFSSAKAPENERHVQEMTREHNQAMEHKCL